MVPVNSWPHLTLPVSVVTKEFPHRTARATLIISLRWDSGSRPAMGRILIFCVFEQRSARDRVIFLWVALSVEWGLEVQKKTTWIITFPQYVFIKVNLLRVGGFHTFFPFSSTHRSHLCVANRQKEKHSIDCQTCFSPHSLKSTLWSF